MNIDHKNNLLSLALRFGVCAACSFLAYRWGGAVVAVFTIPLFGVLLAEPLFDVAGDAWRAVKGAGLSGLEGRHYVYKGRPIAVDQDGAGRRWVCLKDVESVLGIPLEAVSTLRGAAAVATLRTIRRQVFVEADALHALLDTCPSEEAGRLRWWVERTVAYPARRQRERGAKS
jgi:hypothetical protein